MDFLKVFIYEIHQRCATEVQHNDIISEVYIRFTEEVLPMIQMPKVNTREVFLGRRSSNYEVISV